MKGYGIYVWSAYIFTLISFAALYLVINFQLIKEEKRFKSRFTNLADQKIESAKEQETYREILASTRVSKI
tara:strand:+ start:30 stop:242 length:213 start_codon:yes stop_codon:yes gene_type:complete